MVPVEGFLKRLGGQETIEDFAARRGQLQMYIDFWNTNKSSVNKIFFDICLKYCAHFKSIY